jgi:hypothetical protein
MTTPIERRPAAIIHAMDAMRGNALFFSALGEMERVAVEPLPDLEAFLPAWVTHVDQPSLSEDEWDDERVRWPLCSCVTTAPPARARQSRRSAAR